MEMHQAGLRVATMWRALAVAAEKQARSLAQEGKHIEASKAAKYAEAFYWRATGESDSIDLSTEPL